MFSRFDSGYWRARNRILRRRLYRRRLYGEQLEMRLALDAAALFGHPAELDRGNAGTDAEGELALTVNVDLNFAPESFETNTADDPIAVAYGDLDGDQFLDLIVANNASDDLAIYPGFGDGTFGEPRVVELSHGDGPVDVVTADFNRDGALDIATVNLESENVALLINSQGAGFEQLPGIGLGDGVTPRSLVVADLNGDNIVDLATANESDEISILWGQGSAEFAEPVLIAVDLIPEDVENPGVPKLEVTDLNGDASLDLVFAWSFVPAVASFLNDGVGNFSGSVVSQLPHSPDDGWTVGDVTGDAIPDLVATYLSFTDTAEAHVAILAGNTDGQFISPQTFELGLRSILSRGSSQVLVGDVDSNGWNDVVLNDGSLVLLNSEGTLRSIAGESLNATIAHLVDLDRDGDLDAVAITDRTSYPNHVVCSLGNGDGTFAPEGGSRLVRGDQAEGVAVHDLDLDGQLDLVVVNDTGVVVLRSGDERSYQALEHYRLGASRATDFVAVGDVTGDGWPDVVTAGGADNVSVFAGGLGGKLSPPQHLSVGGTTDVLLRDVNQDSQLDIVVGTSGDSVSLFIADRLGGFMPRIDVAASSSSRRIAVADVSGDGVQDIVALNYSSDGGYSVSLGMVGGEWQQPHDYAIAELRYPDDLLVDDFDGDGKADVLVWSRFSGASLALGTGDGTFGAASNVWDSGSSSPLASGDLNGDGATDLVYSDQSDTVVLLNQGDGTFIQDRVLQSQGNAQAIVVEDIDSDGMEDIVLVEPYGNTISVNHGTSSDGFGELRRLPVTSGHLPNAVGVVDIDGDESLDVLTRFRTDGSSDVAVSLGHGNGSFSAPIFVPIHSEGVARPVFVDLDGDGQDEMLTASQEDGELAIVRSDGTSFVVPLPESSVDQGDLNRDGRVDRVTIRPFGEPGGFVAELDSNEGASRNWFFEPIANGSQPVQSLAIDLNRDGLIDLLTGNQVSGDVTVFLAKSAVEFSPPMSFPTNVSDLRSIAAEDFNKDGNLDLALANSRGLHLRYGDGTGSLETHGPLFRCFSCNPQLLTVTDLNEDGQLDVLATEASPSIAPGDAVVVWSGLADGTFARAQEFKSRSHISRLTDHALADMNDDQILDVVAVDAQFHELVIFHGNGDGTLQEPFELEMAGGRFPAGVDIADFNQDGFPDVITANLTTDDLTLFLTKEDGALDAPRSISLGRDSAPRELLAGDFNGDGLADVVAATNGTNDLSLLPGVGNGEFGEAQRLPIDFEIRRLGSYQELSNQLPFILATDTFADTVHRLRLGANAEVSEQEGVITVTNHGRDVSQTLRTDLATLSLDGTPFDDEVAVSSLPTSEYSIVVDGGTGMDAVRWPIGDDRGEPRGTLMSVEIIDFRNSVSGVLPLTNLTADEEVIALVDAGDVFPVDDGWQLRAPVIRDGKFYRSVQRTGLHLLVESNSPWQNPIEQHDVNGNMMPDPFDVLAIINELNVGTSAPELPNPLNVAPSDFRYLDTNGDGALTAADALRIINYLNRLARDAAEGEMVAVPVLSVPFDNHADECCLKVDTPTPFATVPRQPFFGDSNRRSSGDRNDLPVTVDDQFEDLLQSLAEAFVDAKTAP